jgi:Asp/Glu/hydantoin racemase
MDSAMRALLINPNTSERATALMLDIARSSTAANIEIDGATARFGNPLIVNEAALKVAGEAVLDIVDGLSHPHPDGIVISAFGDPGLDAVRRRTAAHVVGIAEASMSEAGAAGRRFSVATTTPALDAAIRACADRYGFSSQLVSLRITPGDPESVMADGATLLAALSKLVQEAIEEDGAEAVIIGGGPLASAARGLSMAHDIPIIEPVPAAFRSLERLCRGQR